MSTCIGLFQDSISIPLCQFLTSIPYSLCYYSFVKSCNITVPVLFLFVKIGVVIRGLLWFHIRFYDSFFFFKPFLWKNTFGVFGGHFIHYEIIFIRAFIRLRYILCIPNLWTVFIMKEYWILSGYFYASIEMITYFNPLFC